MLALYIEAPFATFRHFTAGWYRSSATFLTPTSAYGLILNFGGIESRIREVDPSHANKIPATLTRSDLPSCRIAVGAAVERWNPTSRTFNEDSSDGDPFPKTQSLFQQLHNYPVGASGGERAATSFGNKYNITPIRRELLSDLRAVIVIEDNHDLEEAVRAGLRGEKNQKRYGIPFVGDNSFMLDRVEELSDIPKAFWYEKISTDNNGTTDRSTRMTITIDRADSSKTKTELFAPGKQATSTVPAQAWVGQGKLTG